jgi:hypothetical protein
MDYLSNCMKWRRGEACHFWPKPIILHPKRPRSDAPNMIIIMKAYGLRAQWYHCGDIAMTSCLHVYYQACLGQHLKSHNKSKVCNPKFTSILVDGLVGGLRI